MTFPFFPSRVDELFRFLNSWVPQLYGELEEWKIKEMGYELIEHDTEWAQGGIQKVSSHMIYREISSHSRFPSDESSVDGWRRHCRHDARVLGGE